MRWIVLLAFLCAPLVHGQEPLPPEQAFRLSARLLDAATLVVRYDIAPGYYMYRDKFAFEAAPAGLGTPSLPPGEIKEDKFFGKVETYRDRVEATIPLQAAQALPAVLTLKATSQGCADLGICYPPQEQTVRLNLAGTGAISTVAAGRGTDFVTAQASPAPSGDAGAGDESAGAAVGHERPSARLHVKQRPDRQAVCLVRSGSGAARPAIHSRRR